MSRSGLSVVAVSCDPERTELPGALLFDADGYHTVVLESVARGYSRIKQMAPDLVVVFLEADDVAACQLLSMLRVDSGLSGIRIVTCEMHEGEADHWGGVAHTGRDTSPHTVADQMN